MSAIDQLWAVHKSNIETWFDCSQQGLDALQKLAQLNGQVIKTRLGEASNIVQALLSSKDAQEWMAVQAAALQPVGERAAAYGQHVYDIAARSGSEASRLTEAHVKEMQEHFQAALSSAMEHALPDAGNASGFLATSADAMTKAMGAYRRATKQASDAFQVSLPAVPTASAPAARAATTRSRSAAKRPAAKRRTR